MPDALDRALVLAHDRWLRALARGLVADSHSADDLAQQAWVKALERRPAGASLHAWLRTTLVHFVARLRRTEARRERREKAAAKPEALPSHHELHERERLRRALADAVLALEEPYCTTITLRFFEGLPPRAIARKMQVPVETVRTRIKRGLERLRTQLDHEYGRRNAWALPLASLAQTPTTLASLAGVLLVTLKTKTLVAALACAALSLLIWRAAAGPDAAVPMGTDATAQATPVGGHGLAASQAARTPVQSTPSRPEAAATTGSLLVRVRWGDGTPAPDVGVRVVTKGDEWPQLDECLSRSDAAGDARFAALAPGQVTLHIDRVDRSTSAQVVAGRETVVTVSTRQPETADAWWRERHVEGSVVDPHGAPVQDAAILLSSTWHSPILATRSAADGTFELRDVHPGSMIEARASGFAPSPRSRELYRLADQHDATPRVRIRLVLPAVAGRVVGFVRDTMGRPVAGALVHIGKDEGSWGMYPSAYTASPTPSCVRSDAEGRFSCDTARPGRQEIVARAPGFGPYAGQVEVREGAESAVTIDLAPGVTLRGTARGPRGNALDDVQVRIGNEGRLQDSATRTRADGTYELRDLATGELRVIAARGAGWPTRQLTTSTRLSAVAGALLTWDPVLDEGLVLAGRVLDESGAPLKVRIEAQAEQLTERAGTDVQGRFAIPMWKDLPTRIEVREGGARQLCARAENVRPGTEIVITVLDRDRPNAFLTGTVLDSDGKPCRTAKVQVSQHAFPNGQFAPEAIPDGETGQFRFGPLLPGSWHVEIRSTNHAWLYLAALALAARETKDLGTLQLEKPGALEVRAKRSDGGALGPLAWDLDREDGRSTRRITFKAGVGVLETLAPGDWVALARGQGVAHALHRFTITAGARTLLEVTLQPAAGVPLEIVAPPGDASPSVRLRVRDPEGVEVARERVTRELTATPWKTSLGLAPGRYRVEARTDLGAAGSLALEVQTGKVPPAARLELR